MRLTLSALLLSMSFLACGGDVPGAPAVPSVSVPEAGVPAAPTAPATPSLADAGAPKK